MRPNIDEKNLIYSFIVLVLITSVAGGLLLSPAGQGIAETDTSTDDVVDESEEKTVPSSVEAMSTTSLGDISVDSLENDYTVQRHPDNVEIQSMYVENWENVSAGARVSTLIQADVPENTYPFKYPVVVKVTAVDPDDKYDADGNLKPIATNNTEVELKPDTTETNYSDFTIGDVTEDDIGEYTAYVETDFTFNQQDSTEYEFVVEAQYVPDESLGLGDSTEQTAFIDGTNTTNKANISGVIQTSENYRELPTETFATGYRVSEQSSSYMEDVALPIHSDRGAPSGEMEGFANLSSSDSKSATLSSENGELTATIATEYIERNNPQTLVVRHALTGESDSIELVPITAGGQEIDDETNYELTRGNQSNCLDGNVTSACTFRLSETERDYINQHGELFLSVESDQPAETELVCQSVIGGSLGVDESACGLNSTEAQPNYNPIITQLTAVNDSGDFNQEESPIELADGSVDTTNIGIEIKNSGTAPIAADEPVEVRVNPMFEPVSEETISRTPSDLNMETFNYTLSEPYPSKSVNVDLNGLQTNGGVVEVKVENGEGDSIYKTFENVNHSSGDAETFTLSEIGGYSQSITITANAIYDSPGNEPTLDSIDVRARKTQDVANTTVEVGDFSGGSGSLAPGETRKHVFDSSELDVSTLVDPAATFVGYAGDDTEKLVLKLASSDAKIVADAGGPYKTPLEVISWNREQVGYDTIVSDVQPGPDWTSQGAYDSSTVEWTTTHKDVPKTNLSTSEALQYYKDEGYVHELEKQLPENLQGRLTVDEIRFDTYSGEETFYGTKEEINNTHPITYTEGNWSQGNFSGETLTGYNTSQSAGLIKTSTGDLEWDHDGPKPVYYFDKTETSENLEVLMTAVQETPPPSVSDVPECSASSGFPCWEQGEYMGTERQTSGYGDNTDSICQEWGDYYDPGPDWKLTGLAYNNTFDECNDLQHDVEWKKIDVDDTRDEYEWKLLDYTHSTVLHTPEHENYYKHSRPTYDIEIVWTDAASSSTELWEGPRYDVVPEVEPTEVGLNGTQSKEKSTVPIEDYQWYVNGEEVNDGDLNTGIATIDEAGTHEVKLEVMGSGLTDTDTTTIDAAVDGDFRGEVHPDLSINNSTSKIDIKYRDAAVEARLNNGYNMERYDYRLQVNPAENVMTVENGEQCPDGYESSNETVNGDDYDVLEDGTTQDVKLCTATASKPSGGPDEFVHPDSLDNTSVRQFELNPIEWETFWEGSSVPDTGLRQLTFANPRFIPSISGGLEEFNVRLQVKDNTAQNPSYETIDTSATKIEFCEAGTGNECPAYDSDLDMALDGDPGTMPNNISNPDNVTVNDECPYDPIREEEPCSPEEYENTTGDGGTTSDPITESDIDPVDHPELQQLIWGYNDLSSDSYELSHSNVGEWNPTTEPDSAGGIPTDWEFFGYAPDYANTNLSYYADPTDKDQIRLVQRSTELNYGNPIAHYPMNPDPNDRDEATPDDFWQANDVVNGYHAEGFISPKERNLEGEGYVEIYNKPYDDSTGDFAKSHTFTQYDPSNWTSEDAGTFIGYGLTTSTSQGGTVEWNVSASEINGAWLPINRTVWNESISKASDAITEYGSMGNYADDGWKYEVKYSQAEGPEIGDTSPAGGSYDLGWEGFYFAAADWTDWTSNCSTCSNNNLHQTLGGMDHFTTSFWYTPTVASSPPYQHTVIYREAGPSESNSGMRIVADISELDQVPDDITKDELTLGTYTRGDDDFPRDVVTNSMVDYGENATFRVLLYEPSSTRSGEYADPYPVQFWNLDNDNEELPMEDPQNVTLDDYSIIQDSYMMGEKQTIYQYSVKKNIIVSELSYRPARDYYSSDSSITYDHKMDTEFNIDPEVFDKNANQEVHQKSLRMTKVPYLSLQSDDELEAIQRYSSQTQEWKKGAVRTHTGLGYVDYYEGGEKVATVNAPTGVADPQTQVFLGNGWESLSSGWFSNNPNMGSAYNGHMSDVQIEQYPLSDVDMVNQYNPDPELTMSETRSIPSEDINEALDDSNDLTIGDVTITRDNVYLQTHLDELNKSGVSDIVVTAEPVSAVDENGNSTSISSYEEAVWVINTNGTAGNKTKELTTNYLVEDKYYTEFELTVQIDTEPSERGEVAPSLDQFTIQNYIPGTYMTDPPVPVDGDLSTGNSTDVVNAPDEPDGQGGGLNVVGEIDHGIISDGQSVPVEFAIRHNNTVIHNERIALDDTSTASGELSWKDLNELGIEPRSDEYIVEFRVIEDPDGRWDEESIEIGRFTMESR